MTSPLSRNAHPDLGFTLIEFLVAMVITAITAIAIAGSLIISFRTVGATADQVAQSHDAQTLSFWLLPDLQSLHGSTPDTTHPNGPTRSQCIGALPAGTFIFNLTWTDYNATTYQSDYYTTLDASGQQLVLKRYYCSSATPAPTILTLVDHVRNIPGSVSVTNVGSTYTMHVTTIGPAGQPYTFQVSGGGR